MNKFSCTSKVCCLLCCWMLSWYDMRNEILWDSMVWFEIPMLWYEISMLCDFNDMLCYGVCCKRYAGTDCIDRIHSKGARLGEVNPQSTSACLCWNTITCTHLKESKRERTIWQEFVRSVVDQKPFASALCIKTKITRLRNKFYCLILII